MIEITDGDYRDRIQSGTTLVDFSAPWCMPCIRMENHVEAFASNNPDNSTNSFILFIDISLFAM